MKKIVLFILIIFSSVYSYAQTPVVKVEQYKVIIERTIIHNNNYTCYDWVVNSNPNTPCPANTVSTITPSSGNYAGQKLCYVTAPCSGNSCGPSGDNLSVNIIFKNGTTRNITSVNPSSYPQGIQQLFSDTVDLFEPALEIDRVSSTVSINERKSIGDYYSNNSNFTTGCKTTQQTDYMLLDGRLLDSSMSSTYTADRYYIKIRVRVIPNLDPTYTLPSHDKVLIRQTTSTNFFPTWQFKPTINSAWQTVPAGLTSGSRGEVLNVSGIDLFGSNYTTYLNSTIYFRVRNSGNTVFSEQVPFTLRLSSPHITNITTTNLICYDRNEGALKLKFDRPFLDGERLNILLYDSVNRFNYSVFNIRKLDAPDNSYTWKNELRAGTYFVSLLGKYSNGLVSDLYVNNRIDTVRLYEALNSVNFENGFNTRYPDNFEAIADFTRYSQATYTGALTHFAFKTITQPNKIRFAARVDSNIVCKGSAAGVVRVKAAGGWPDLQHFRYSVKHTDSSTYGPWVRFDNNLPENLIYFTQETPAFSIPYYDFSEKCVIQKIRNLKAGDYVIRVRDSADCYAKDSVGNEVTYAFKITEPAKGITIDQMEITPITSVDSANGKLRIRITGGTPFPPGESQRLPYDVIVTDTLTKHRFALSDSIRIMPGDTMEVKAKNFPEGVYSLEIRDAYYNLINPPYNTGCNFVLYISFKKPAPLTVKISKVKQISCFNDKDARLLATARGGIQNDTTRYQFKWYRFVEGVFVLLPGSDTTIKITDSLISGLGLGRYRVLVTDKFGNTKSDTFDLQQPNQMQITFATTPATCYTTADGTMQVTSITGGSPFMASGLPKYTYEWSNGALTQMVDSVPGGKFLVVVKDSMGCYATDTVEVVSPVRILTTNTITKVSCYNSNDGAIQVNTSGGVAPYAYLWNTGATTSAISGLTPGRYWFRVTDANNICFETDTIDLERPDTILVNLGEDRKLCLGQTLRLNGTANNVSQPLSYSWTGTGGFTANTPKVNIVNAGTYTLAVSNTSGCTLKDTIVVTRLDSTVNTDFIVSTQAFKNDRVILVSLSAPYPQDSVKWIIPKIGNTIQILSQSDRTCELVFADTGRYELALKVYYKSGCIDDTVKYINIINRDVINVTGNQANAFLKSATIVPNPNTGVFELRLTFNEATRAKVRMINTLTNLVVDSKEVTIPNSSMYTVPYNLPGTVLNGIYVLVIETPKGSFVYKVVIAR
jgi:hypothetical protein